MQFINLEAQYKEIKEKLDKEVLDVIAGGRYINGPNVSELEKRLAEYVGRKYCVTCGNGTDALSIVLMAWGIGKGDAVFVPDFTFFATAEVVAHCGATPVFVDIDINTFNIDAASLKDAVEKTVKEGKLTPKVVIPVDLFGQPADYDEVYAVAKQYGLKVLEDGAQGFGGTYKGRKACSLADASTTSFFPSKPLGCYGDGGAIFTDSEEEALLLRSIRVHGSNPNDKYDNVRIGLNSRLDTVQAAVLNCKMDVFDKELVTRQLAADCYSALLKGYVEIPEVKKDNTSSWAQYSIRLTSPEQRKEVVAKLKEQQIPTMIYYPCPLHLQTAFKSLGGQVGDFPKTELACNTILSLPMHPYLNDRMVATICNHLKKSL